MPSDRRDIPKGTTPVDLSAAIGFRCILRTLPEGPIYCSWVTEATRAGLTVKELRGFNPPIGASFHITVNTNSGAIDLDAVCTAKRDSGYKFKSASVGRLSPLVEEARKLVGRAFLAETEAEPILITVIDASSSGLGIVAPKELRCGSTIILREGTDQLPMEVVYCHPGLDASEFRVGLRSELDLRATMPWAGLFRFWTPDVDIASA